MIPDILSVGYFIRWAFNWIQTFGADIVQTVEAGFELSAIDVEDQDLNQIELLQNKIIAVTNTAMSSDLVPMIYTQSGLPAAFVPVIIEAGAYIKSICLAGKIGATVSSTVLGTLCGGGYDNVLGDTLATGVYTPQLSTVSENIDGVISTLADVSMILSGSTTPTEEYQLTIIYMQPSTLARQVVR